MVCSLAAALLLAGSAQERLRGEARAPRATLDVILQHPALDSLIDGTMRREAERIWQREGVQLRWHDPADEPLTAAHLVRVQIVNGYARSAPSSSETVLGDF